MLHKISRKQYNSKLCFICGLKNSSGLKASFYETENGELIATFVPTIEHQSYPGRLHGGIVSAILDETIGRAINIADTHTWGVTVEFKIRFRKPVPVDREVRAIARITRDSSRIFEGTGEIVLEDGTIAAEATGKYVKMPIEQIAAVEFADTEWFPDAAPLPGQIDVGSDT